MVRLLMDHATMVVSGTKIASEVGVSPSTVWHLVEQLRALGVDIAGHLGTGYRLKAMPDLLLPEMLAPLIRGTIFSGHLHHYYNIDSTSTVAMDAARDGTPEGSVFLSEQQSAGRGRGGNRWHSPRSTGIYCSLVLRPVLPPSELLIFALAAGLAVQAAVGELDPALSPDLKWPNDLLVRGKKFCGILTEMNAEATRVRHVVVGIGVNVNQTTLPADLETTATSLRMATGSEYSRLELCAALLKSLDREYRSLGTHPHHAILRRFAERSSMVRGVRVRVEEEGGYQGITEGLDSRGFLQVRTPQGLRTVLTGTVRVE
ncbi:MAG TPA: biotin--[acetyl-CoA-carboxylase] ligase [Terriglobales bacterium]|nr:biotin--[acetyl-CoA-carboxylase] ligase [Terriglobales bacterium]